MNIVIQIEHYDYFGGHKFEHIQVEGALAGWNKYKELAQKDFNYGDAWRFTEILYTTTPCAVETKPQRLHARSYYEWCTLEKAKVVGDLSDARIECEPNDDYSALFNFDEPDSDWFNFD